MAKCRIKHVLYEITNPSEALIKNNLVIHAGENITSKILTCPNIPADVVNLFWSDSHFLDQRLGGICMSILNSLCLLVCYVRIA